MRKLYRVLFGLSLLLVIASWATCHFGVEHEIGKIPAEQRALMADFDWIGAEWIGLGVTIFLAGALAAILALILRMIRKRRMARQSSPGAARA
jgi:hypothetical protein